MTTETQATISAWAEQTFGPGSSNARVAARANEEMAELLRAATSDPTSPKVMEEAADVVIVIYRLATRLGWTLELRRDQFQPTVSPFSWAAWANNYLADALTNLAAHDASIYAFSPLQSCVMALCCLGLRLGADLQAEIDAKMAINRSRVWKQDGSGHGYHVRDKG